MKKTFLIKKNRLYSDVDYTSLLSRNLYLGYELRRIELEPLSITSGAVCLFDPYAAHAVRPFLQRFPTGDAVPFALSVSTSQGDRIAFAGLHFSDSPAVCWKLALFEEKDVLRLTGDGTVATTIGSGLAAFGDYIAARDYTNLVKTDSRDFHPLDSVVSLDGCMAERFALPQSPLALCIFSSGWGDGEYAAYIGLDANEEVTDLLCDFGMVEHPKKKEDSATVSFTFDINIEEMYVPDPRCSDSENSINKWSTVIAHADEVTGSALFNAYSRRGYAYHSAGRAEEAIQDYKRAIELGHSLEKEGNFKFHAWTLYDNLGQIYRDKGLYREAIAVFEHAKNFGDTFYAGAYTNLIDLYLAVKEYDRAKAVADEMVADRPQDPIAYDKRAEVLLACEEYEQALPDLDMLIDVFKLSESILEKSRCLSVLGRIDEALAVLETYLVDNKANEAYYYSRAQLFNQKRNISAAYADLLKAYDVNPDYLPALRLLIELDLLSFNYGSVVKWASRFLDCRPGSEYAYAVRAEAYMHLGRYDYAIEDYMYILAHIKKDVSYLSLLLKAFLAARDFGKAKRLTKYLHSLDEAAYINAAGLLLQNKGKQVKAERYLATAYKLAGNEAYLLDMIDCFVASGNLTKAQGAVKMLDSVNEGSEQVLLKRALVYRADGETGEKLLSLYRRYVHVFLKDTDDEAILARVRETFFADGKNDAL